jgi:malto-oligosyltrehalose trehalohydrolase
LFRLPIFAFKAAQMSEQNDITLVIEPALLFEQASGGTEQRLAQRLREYANLNLLAIVFISKDAVPDEIAANMLRHGLRCTPRVVDLDSRSIHACQDEQWKTEPDSLDPAKVVLAVSSSATLDLAKQLSQFNAVSLPELSVEERHALYDLQVENDSLNRLFVAKEHGLAGVMSGLHWFDALPAGAKENIPSGDVRLGAFSVKRDVARVAIEAWASSVEVVVDRNGWKRTIGMSRTGERRFVAEIEHFQPGDRYAFALDGDHDKLYPDPRSRSQPEGVHGLSALTGPETFPWRDQNWQGVSKDDLIIYELHIGTFTEHGTFQSAIDRLPELVELGITAIELLPVVESAGRWNWGYDGVNLYAPNHHYGTPNDLRQLVDRCHELGLAIILDVVYNHPGPEGNYLAPFGPYLSKKHHTPWGPAYNFDGRDRSLSREWVLDNVIYWLSEFHFDGLRFDAIHFMFDESDFSIVKEIGQRVRQLCNETGRRYLLIGETNIFDGSMIRPISEGGAGFDAVWCDDMMHSIYSVGSPQTRLTDRSYEQHTDIAEALKYGFLYQGPPTHRIVHDAEADANTKLIESMVVALQTHDSVGNQPQGKRLHALTNAEFHRSASALSLLYPAIPMLFMGDESLEPNPFHYFVDFHDPWLRDAIAKSRRHEHPQQNWDESISPLSERAFVESNVSRIGSDAEQRQWTRDWYRKLISIRKQWKADQILLADNLTVVYEPKFQTFQLVYESTDAIKSVVVRLNTPEVIEAGPVAIDVEGAVIATSVLGSDDSRRVLDANHAVVVEGRVRITS